MIQRNIIIIILLGILLFIFGLSAMDFWNTLEARRVLIAKNMIERSDWLIPYLDNYPQVTKPPLVYWTMASSALIFGIDKEFSYRFPCALAGIGTLLIIYLIGRILFNEKTGFFSALILATTILFRWESQYAELDMVLTLFPLLLYTSFLKGFYQTKTRNFIIFCFFLHSVLL